MHVFDHFHVVKLMNDHLDDIMTVSSLEMSDEPKIPLKGESFSDFIATFDMSVVFETYFDL